MKRYSSIYTVCIAVVALVAAVALSSCNARKKNTAAARQYTAFITKYNIYYNGDRHYVETLDEMERNYEDDFTARLLMHPAEARANEKLPQPTGDFNRSIEKAQKAIQLRSITKKPQKKHGKSHDDAYKAWMKREEYNPFLHNAWMMMGRSQYMNGDFAGAASTFFYTSRRFNWLKETVTEARLWQARSYLAMDWNFEAENIVTRIKPESLTNKELNRLYNLDFAELYIKTNEYAKAVPYLEKAISLSSGNQKTRLWFLLGQLQAQLGDKNAAYRAFDKAGSASNATYRTKFNARIKQSEVFTGTDIEPEVKALKRMTRYDRNKEYLDQIYYAIGNLYLSRSDTTNAIKNYQEAIEKSTRGGIEKAIAQVTLGNLFYNRHDYEKAQPCYSEGVPQLPDNYPDIVTLRLRTDVLDELAVYSQNVHLQDSLLRLSGMTKDEQLTVINKIIEELRKKEKEEAEAARREEYMAEQAAQGSTLQGGAAKQTNTYTLNTDGSWYFYNTPTRNAGKTEFQRRWGARKLEDDWRRRNKANFNTLDFGENEGENAEAAETDTAEGAENGTETDSEDDEARKRAEDPHFPEFYLKQIPTTDEQKKTSHEIIQEGLYNMGVILKDRLEDFTASRAEFERLLTDYPDNTYRLEVYYNLYLMFTRMGDSQMAEHYRNLILTEFADSNYGVAMRDPHYLDNLKAMDSVQNGLYEKAYGAYLENNNATVHDAYSEMTKRYPLSPLMPKFMFLHALAYATEGRNDDFNATLRDMLERYPNTDMTPIANEWLKGMAHGRQLHADESGANMRGMIWDIALTNDSTAKTAENIEFRLDEADRQLLVFVFATDEVNRNELLYEIARHNFNAFVVKDFDLEVMSFGRLGMIVVKDFENMNELNHYRRVLADSPTFRLPAGVRPVVISTPNFDTLLKSGASLDTYFRFLEEQNYHDAQQGILPTEDIEPLPAENAEVEPEPKTAVEPTPEPSPEAETKMPTLPEAPKMPKAVRPTKNEEKPAAKTTEKAPEKQAKPTDKPAAKPKPKTPTAPKRPVFDPGSEGDDPLFD